MKRLADTLKANDELYVNESYEVVHSGGCLAIGTIKYDWELYEWVFDHSSSECKDTCRTLSQVETESILKMLTTLNKRDKAGKYAEKKPVLDIPF